MADNRRMGPYGGNNAVMPPATMTRSLIVQHACLCRTAGPLLCTTCTAGLRVVPHVYNMYCCGTASYDPIGACI